MKDKRIHKRKDCQLEFECQTYFGEDGVQKRMESPDCFQVLNISQGGLLVSGDRKLKEQMILWYTLYLEKVPYTVLSRVKWAETKGTPYLYGVEFLSPPNMMYRHIGHFVQEEDFFRTVEQMIEEWQTSRE